MTGDAEQELHTAIRQELTALIAGGETRADRLAEAVMAVIGDHDAAAQGTRGAADAEAVPLRALLAAIEAGAAAIEAGAAGGISSQLTLAERELWAAAADAADA